ncbi:rubrerythrin-like domain-containing protein [Salinigranum halophilum]|uniref:rubrerythrin-like domain-containing protein n=1 Tax=Salinigranum halophilum TaxID=2565931 RepID=UPI0010A8D751|nr:rubrerythrin-like domain-containing protein [Salinigranum halophilum]
MVLNNADIDPHRNEHGYYECLSCGTRTTSDDPLGRCVDCGGEVRNIGVARE